MPMVKPNYEGDWYVDEHIKLWHSGLEYNGKTYVTPTEEKI